MRIKIVAVLVVLSLFSCTSNKNFIESVDSVSMKIDHLEAINVGSTFEYTLYANLKSGGTKKIRHYDWISFDSTVVQKVDNRHAKIIRPLQSAQQEKLPVEIRLSHQSQEVISMDTIPLNFKGPIIAEWTPGHVSNGLEERASASTLFGRDGLKGRKGGNGQDGVNGPNLTGYLWMDTESLRLVLIDDTSKVNFYFRSNDQDSVAVFLVGGHAGNGANGSDGGNGKNQKGSKPPGKGGDGGDGGDGGNGGNGGSLILFIHPNASHLKNSISLINYGGFPGIGGVTGAPGSGGQDSRSRIVGASGNLGKNGVTGIKGEDGPPLTISIVAFDFTQFSQ